MTKKASLTEINKELNKPKPKAPKTREAQRTIEANAPRGERANFLKLTITMPAEMLSALKELGVNRKAVGEKDTDISSLLREAASVLLNNSKVGA
jgi:hypothetical protein